MKKKISEIKNQITKTMGNIIKINGKCPNRELSRPDTIEEMVFEFPLLDDMDAMIPSSAVQNIKTMITNLDKAQATIEINKIKLSAMQEVIKNLPKDNEIYFDTDWNDDNDIQRWDFNISTSHMETDEEYLKRLKEHEEMLKDRAAKAALKAKRLDTVRGLKARVKEMEAVMVQHGLNVPE